MVNAQAGSMQHTEGGTRWATAIASLMVGTAFFGLWFWLLLSCLGFQTAGASALGWRWIAAVFSVLGFSVALRCVWDFGWTGRGTPAPVAPPRKLVVVGYYRYARNPMYLGFFGGWAGLWVVFGHVNLPLISAVLAVVLCVALFVRLYEEPTLRKMFGAEYEEYCRNVRAWVPRLRAWQGRAASLETQRTLPTSS